MGIFLVQLYFVLIQFSIQKQIHIHLHANKKSKASKTKKLINFISTYWVSHFVSNISKYSSKISTFIYIIFEQ